MKDDIVTLYCLPGMDTPGVACTATRTPKSFLVIGQVPGLRFGHPFYKGKRLTRHEVETVTGTKLPIVSYSQYLLLQRLQRHYSQELARAEREVRELTANVAILEKLTESRPTEEELRLLFTYRPDLEGERPEVEDLTATLAQRILSDVAEA